jgi:hypothetical protein
MEGAMKRTVREIPAADDAGNLEQLAVVPLAVDLGPNGDAVRDLLARAAALTDAEIRRLDQEAGWRWGRVTPLLGVTNVTTARAVAQLRGRSEGRAAAMRAMETSVASIVGARQGRPGHHLAAVVASAALALLVRDLVEPEVFETLFGPWHEVKHR